MTDESPNAGTAIARYTPLEADIAAFLAKHENVVHDVATTKGMELAKKDRAECRTLRIRVEEARVAEKKDALEYGRKVDSEAKRLTGIIAPAEEAYDAQIKREEQRKEAERQAKIEAERNRVANIRAMIDGMKQSAGAAISETAAEVADRIQLIVGIDPANKAHAYAEFHIEAINAHAATLEFLRDLHSKKVRQELELAELERGRAELVEREAAQAKRDHEAKIAREAQERADQEARDEAARLERIARETADRAEREARARDEAERREQIRKEDERLAAERERLAEQARQQEAEQKRIDAERRQQDAERERQAQATRDAEARAAAEQEAAELRERNERERKAEEERQRVAAKKKADQLAKDLRHAKRPTAEIALAWIVELAGDDSLTDTQARTQIQIVAIANTKAPDTKAAEAEQARVRA